MDEIFLGLFGFWMVAVGAEGNGAQAACLVTGSMSGYVPWLIALIIIAAIAEIPDGGRDVATGFLILVTAAFLLKNWNAIKTETQNTLKAIEGL